MKTKIEPTFNSDIITSLLSKQKYIVVLKTNATVERFERDVKSLFYIPKGRIEAFTSRSDVIFAGVGITREIIAALQKGKSIVVSLGVFAGLEWLEYPELLSDRILIIDESIRTLTFSRPWHYNRTIPIDTPGNFDQIVSMGDPIDDKNNEFHIQNIGLSTALRWKLFKMYYSKNFIKSVKKAHFEKFQQANDISKFDFKFTFKKEILQLPKEIHMYGDDYTVCLKKPIERVTIPVKLTTVKFEYNNNHVPFSTLNTLKNEDYIRNGINCILSDVGDMKFSHIGDNTWIDTVSDKELDTIVVTLPLRISISKTLAILYQVSEEELYSSIAINSLFQSIQSNITNTTSLSVYLLDDSLTPLIKEHLDNVIEETIVVPVGKPQKVVTTRRKGLKATKAMTASERQKAYRERQKLKKGE